MEKHDANDIRKAIRASITPAVGSMFKWSLASLLTINGGAVLAILQADQADFALVRAAGATFGAGIGGAIIAGLAAAITLIVALMNYLDPKADGLSDAQAGVILVGMFLTFAGVCGSLVCFLVGLSQLNDAVTSNRPAPVASAPAQPTTVIKVTVGTTKEKVGIPTAE